ncbi:hypothetical protein BH09BAC3_BH09BAC3_32860 [soil metagenome]
MFHVTVLSSTGFDYSQQKKLDNAVAKFEAVMNTDALKFRMLNFRCPIGERFEKNLGLTNEQVFHKLWAGEESYLPGSNHTADLYLVLKKKWKNPFSKNQPIGYSKLPDREIHIYSWWFNSAQDHELAGHIAYEWACKLGFENSNEPTPTTNCSVPVAFGKIVEELVKGVR